MGWQLPVCTIRVVFKTCSIPIMYKALLWFMIPPYVKNFTAFSTVSSNDIFVIIDNIHYCDMELLISSKPDTYLHTNSDTLFLALMQLIQNWHT